MIDIPYVLSEDEINTLAPCTPDSPPEVGDYIVRVDGMHYNHVSPRGREQVCRGHVCEVVGISEYDSDDVDIRVRDPQCKSHGPGWILSYFAHYRKAQLRDEAL